MKILILEALMSAVYIFDVSVYPFIHIPFYFLTLLYFASILEIYGMVRLTRFVWRRISRHESYREATRMLAAAVLPSVSRLSQ
jgi:hypothetical protein